MADRSNSIRITALIYDPTTARQSSNPNDFALIALLGLLGLRIFEACGAGIADLSEEHGHRVLRVHGKVVLVPLPPAVGRAIDRTIEERLSGPILRTLNQPAILFTSM